MADPNNPVRDVMSHGAISVDEKLTLRSWHLPVVERRTIVGVVSVSDVLPVLADYARATLPQ